MVRRVMRRLRSAFFAALLVLLAAPPPAPAAATGPAEAAITPLPRPRPTADPDARCTDDGRRCVGAEAYLSDVCRLIEAAAADHALDPGFFARLLWRESLFDAAAVSPAGAEGIAQFMPGTAKLRGLDDAFNPAKALEASAEYLAELARDYGNLGLAAAAYNGGEARVERFIAKAGGLPAETRAYVHAITGHSAEAWRDAPPDRVDLALAAKGDFHAACLAHAAGRGSRAFASGPALSPWGVIVATHRDREGAERQATRLKNRHADLLAAETVAYGRTRMRGGPLRLHNAQVGRDSRAEAEALCARLRAAGADCMVLRN